MLTPVVVKAGGATWLFILRVLQGMGEVSKLILSEEILFVFKCLTSLVFFKLSYKKYIILWAGFTIATCYIPNSVRLTLFAGYNINFSSNLFLSIKLSSD